MAPLSRDPNAAEKARRAEKKADAEAGLRVIDTNKNGTTTGIGGATKAGGSGGGFKKGGFKSSFTAVKGPAAPTKKNVLGDYDDDNDQLEIAETNELVQDRLLNGSSGFQHDNTQSDTDEEYENNGGGGECEIHPYYGVGTALAFVQVGVISVWSSH
ncbi:hypothetical protein EYZ11_003064 [Aspergillus tanneri]|uniref:Uncharacterized protein n=1 Tax=Aspergillus tanneri TaxID=1220188 RepID=A0A4S3JPB5_9EURO|nr:hypothetical protein EYZ11_003064 [Aspergillus tanneri]